MRPKDTRVTDFMHRPPVHVLVGSEGIVQELRKVHIVRAQFGPPVMVLAAPDDVHAVVKPRVWQHKLVHVRGPYSCPGVPGEQHLHLGDRKYKMVTSLVTK